jgi:hypothetical protein
MAPVSASPGSEDEVYSAPSPEIIRLLARQTAAVMMPPAPSPVPVGLGGFGVDGALSAAASSSGSPDPRFQRSRSSPTKTGYKLDSTQDTRTPSTNLGSKFSTRSFSPNGFLDDERSDMSSPTKFGSEGQFRSPQPGYDDDELHGIHDVPWNSTIFRPNEWGLYGKATPKVCCCLRPFEPGQNRCTKCGTRRPVQEDENWRKLEKAMHRVDLQHSEPFERSYAWAEVYGQKKYELSLQKFVDEETFMQKNGHFQPQLNERSMAISERWKQNPIQDRTEEILYKRNEYLEMRRRQVEDSEICAECTFCPRLHPKSVGMQGRDLRNLFRWDMRRAHKVHKKLSDQLEAESHCCPFTPELTSTSRKIAEDYSAVKVVHDRLFDDHRRREREYFAEQETMKKLTPTAYAMAGEKNAKSSKRPASARPVGTHRAWWENGPPSLLSARAGSPGSPDVGEATRKREPARASQAVLLHRPISHHVGFGSTGALRHKKDFAYSPEGERRSTSRQRSKSYAVVAENTAPPVHKSAITGGKNVIKLSEKNAELIEAVKTISAASFVSEDSALFRSSFTSAP